MYLKFMHYFVWNIILFRITYSLNSTIKCKRVDPSGNIIEECCSDYEEINSICVECKKGFTSNNGQSCRPCGNNSYGLRCGFECNCNVLQRCDHIIGCEAITTTLERTTVTQWMATPNQTTGYTTDFEGKSTLTTPNGDTDTKNVSSGISLTDVIVYYTLSLLVVVLAICLCYVLIRQKVRKKRHSISVTAGDRNNPNVIHADQPDVEDIEDNDYEDIDDEGVVEQSIAVDPSNEYLLVVNECQSSGSSSSEKTIRDSYINPYEPCISTENTKSSYEKLPQISMVFFSDRSNQNTERREELEMIESQAEPRNREYSNNKRLKRRIEQSDTKMIFHSDGRLNKADSFKHVKCVNIHESGEKGNSLHNITKRRHSSC